MKALNDILRNIETVKITGNLDLTVKGITADSRKVEQGFVFFAFAGTNADGHNFIKNAVENGAVAVVYTDECNDCENLTAVKVKDGRKALAIAAANFYGNPSKKMKIVAVTGTNGKTTIATTLFRLFNKLGHKSGLISTVANYVADEKIPTKLTTPDVVELNRLFDLMTQKHCEYCFMEVTSHAIDQKRIDGIDFDGVVFTNLTQDHLDYHKTFKNYRDTKKSFIDALKKDAFALTNIDDKNGLFMVQNHKNYLTYSLKTIADFKAKIIEKHFDATLVEIQGKEVWLQFVGTFNVYNLLAVFGVTKILLNLPDDEILAVLSEMKPVEGRFDVVKGKGIVAIVDYAHTPDALENTLKELKSIKNENQKIITVVGAGGNRDKDKRPKMAAIAGFYSDLLILTSDNPRNENPETILDDMEKGLDNDSEFLRITDRRQAIKTAVKFAQKGDLIFVAGKGHENYQEINGVRHHFDDKEEILKLIG